MKAPSANDIALILGFISLACGLWMLQPWISLTVTGTTLIAYGVASEFLAAMLQARTGKGKKGP